MHYLTPLLALLFLTAFASAIEIRAYYGNNCQYHHLWWTDAQPEICHTLTNATTRMGSYAFMFVPTDWRISTRSHSGGGCKDLEMVIEPRGNDWVCHGDRDRNAWDYTGGGYSFMSSKRDQAVAANDTRECRGPDGMVFEDGATYAFEGADEETVQTMVSALASKIGRGYANRFCSEIPKLSNMTS
jgi:hypothetical protein